MSSTSPDPRRQPLLARLGRRLRREAPLPPPLDTEGHLVLGMHRSGTSCLTGMLEAAGLWLGDVSRRNRSHPKGNLEDTRIGRVNDRILRQFGGSWLHPPEIRWSEVDPRRVLRALEPYRAHPRWLAKDPRWLLTLDAWLPHIPQRRIVGSFRHPRAVASSLAARNRMKPDDALALWTRYNRTLVALHQRRPFPLVSFDLTGAAYLEQVRILCDGLGLSFAGSDAKGFYDRYSISHAPSEGGELPAETAELYDYLNHHRIGRSAGTAERVTLSGGGSGGRG